MSRSVDEKRPEFLKVRALALALPGVTERPSHGYPNWRTTRAQFAAYNDFKGHPTLYVFVEEDFVAAAVKDPRYSDSGYARGGKRWLALRLDQKLDWAEVKDLLALAHRGAQPVPKVSKPRARGSR